MRPACFREGTSGVGEGAGSLRMRTGIFRPTPLSGRWRSTSRPFTKRSFRLGKSTLHAFSSRKSLPRIAWCRNLLRTRKLCWHLYGPISKVIVALHCVFNWEPSAPKQKGTSGGTRARTLSFPIRRNNSSAMTEKSAPVSIRVLIGFRWNTRSQKGVCTVCRDCIVGQGGEFRGGRLFFPVVGVPSVSPQPPRRFLQNAQRGRLAGDGILVVPLFEREGHNLSRSD